METCKKSVLSAVWKEKKDTLYSHFHYQMTKEKENKEEEDKKDDAFSRLFFWSFYLFIYLILINLDVRDVPFPAGIGH